SQHRSNVRSTRPSTRKRHDFRSSAGTSKWLRTKKSRVGVTQLRAFSKGVSLFSGKAVTTRRGSGMNLSGVPARALFIVSRNDSCLRLNSNSRGVTELQKHRLAAAREVGQGIGSHVQKGRRVDMKCHEVGVAGLQVGNLVNIVVLAAADAAL